LFELAVKARTGPAQWFAEFVATFGLLITILAVSRFKSEAIPVAVGLYITAAYWFTASTSFANPAVTIARALTNSFSGIAPADVPMFIVAQLAGALAGLGVMRWFFDRLAGSRPQIGGPTNGARSIISIIMEIALDA
jgi:glycerol uptake facilitator-like aquaporin